MIDALIKRVAVTYKCYESRCVVNNGFLIIHNYLITLFYLHELVENGRCIFVYYLKQGGQRTFCTSYIRVFLSETL